MNHSPSPGESTGYLIVKVSTARGAIPLEGASVIVRGAERDESGVLYSMRTNRDGQTERISLPTPPRSASEAPGYERPYAVYGIDVFLDGYVPISFENVPIFPSILSIQPAVMVPTPEYYGDARPYFSATPIQPEDAETSL